MFSRRSVSEFIAKFMAMIGLGSQQARANGINRETVERVADEISKKYGFEPPARHQPTELDNKIDDYLNFIAEKAESLGVTEHWDIYLKNYKAMPSPIKHLAVCNLCLGQVINGGFAQFYHNSDGVTANEVAIGFEETGEPALAQLVRETFGYFGGTVPRDRVGRQNILGEFGDVPDEKSIMKAYEYFSSHDKKFYGLIDDVDNKLGVGDGYMKRIIARYPDLLK